MNQARVTTNSVKSSHRYATVLHNEVLRIWEHPEAGKIRQPVPAARFSDTPAEMRESAALLGQHNDEILGELNRDKETIDRLRAEEIIL